MGSSGIIPAGAGLTVRDVFRDNLARDHPRGCGAHYHSKFWTCLCGGSSPRVRGSLEMTAEQKKEYGIIPAGAGLTGTLNQKGQFFGDHPRGCGAHIKHGRLRQAKLGSSPRVRGSRRACQSNLCRYRIIPAGAGLTAASDARQTPVGDHPRGCGAHVGQTGRLQVTQGSSPRVRGSPAYDTGERTQQRIIPAGAGLTLMRFFIVGTRRDHPRGCGAHHDPHKPVLARQGSSPRVRGSPCRCTESARRRGIIPAGAGLTAHFTCFSLPCRDHPRGCGAHTKKSQ